MLKTGWIYISVGQVFCTVYGNKFEIYAKILRINIVLPVQFAFQDIMFWKKLFLATNIFSVSPIKNNQTGKKTGKL